MSYPRLIEYCDTHGIRHFDLKLSLLIRALDAIQTAHDALLMEFGARANALFMTVNIDGEMLESMEFREIISRCQIVESTLFEVSEGLAPDAVDRLMAIADMFGLRLALDDSDQMTGAVRHALLNRCALVKVDFTFTRKELGFIGNLPPKSIIDRLKCFQHQGIPYVLEGVETRDEADFIRNNWGPNSGEVLFQGWSIEVNEELERFFKPLHDAPGQPKGYTWAR